ncbi:MAG: site-specific DNA-methyltransferase, partial [Olsenella sp.]
MERIDTVTPDLTQENIDKIAKLFPDVVTEAIGEDGELRRAIDFDALRGDLADEVVDGQRERYQFTWPGKAAAKLEARTPCDKTLRPCIEESKDWDTTQNLYIEGDNLDALKLLRETYAGKVKMIYIDPPYNTGHDFIYDDDFSQSREDYEDASDEYDEEGGRLVANPESNGRFHSDWCSMMYPRLLLARDLLTSDGVIFISIDDNECTNLANMCDEIFRKGFLNRFTWVSNLKGRQIGVSGAAKCTESIYAYSKNADLPDIFTGKVSELKKLMPSSYKGLDYEVKTDNKGEFVIKNELYNSNSIFNESTRRNLVFDICWNPDTKQVAVCDCGARIGDGFIRISP